MNIYTKLSASLCFKAHPHSCFVPSYGYNERYKIDGYELQQYGFKLCYIILVKKRLISTHYATPKRLILFSMMSKVEFSLDLSLYFRLANDFYGTLTLKNIVLSVAVVEV